MTKPQLTPIPATYTIDNVVIPLHMHASRARRKTIALKIMSTGIHIYTPMKFSQPQVDVFLVAKHDWILRMREKTQHIAQQSSAAKTYTPWDTFRYFGTEYIRAIIESDAKRTSIHLDDHTMQCTIPRTTVQPARLSLMQRTLDTRYRMQAQTYLTTMTHELALKHGFHPSLPVTTKSYKSVYGKCRTTKKSLRERLFWSKQMSTDAHHILYNYHIIKFPPSIIEHVIIHELSHTKHMGHGKNFRDLVYRLDPHAQEHRKRLREHGSIYVA